MKQNGPSAGKRLNSATKKSSNWVETTNNNEFACAKRSKNNFKQEEFAMISNLQRQTVGELKRRDLPTESIIDIMLMLDNDAKLDMLLTYLNNNPDADEKQTLIEAIMICQSCVKNCL